MVTGLIFLGVTLLIVLLVARTPKFLRDEDTTTPVDDSIDDVWN